ncbi:YicC family protein [Candidatus Desantisbacteria bacterium]|nr:YicC family protein [Candidatus Desantisbacteria bacterium]
MKSMTGYGYSEIDNNNYLCKIKIYSVNARYFESIIKMPQEYLILEREIKKNIQKYISRGRINVFIDLIKEDNPKNYKINFNMAKEYHNLIKEISSEFNLTNNITAIDLLKLKEVIKYEETTHDIESIRSLINDTLSQAIIMFDNMRQAEGHKLKSDIEDRIDNLKKINTDIQQSREELKSASKERLEKRLRELLPDNYTNETLINMEFALFIDRSDITEETVRIESHLNQFKQIINDDSLNIKGKQLDFISQELNREFNTIGSKANFYSISDKVIQAKCDLEKIREQLQNLE